ncbi:hypothetical protein RND81_14G058800 [Saponaria officinalis]|uniref:Uncharacterized protein n=1 Tax=Saponaria officinalis TaxID=3572 RepID=A0AAW1GJS6_SAPOF
MCPLRFILVFFSAILAAYFAWRSVRSSDQNDQQLNTSIISQDFCAENSASSTIDKQERKLSVMIRDGFWVFVDMASGRYLWRNLKGMKKEDDKVLSL